MTMPAQKPGKSKQDYRTPDNFMEAVKRRFGKLWIDLAANAENSQTKTFYWGPDNGTDSLALDWGPADPSPGEWCWLNPPFSNIAPWAKKCAESHLPILFLVPAAVGANWFRDHVHGKALVIALNGRLDFGVGAPYPRDCMLCVYHSPGIKDYGVGFEVWNWRQP